MNDYKENKVNEFIKFLNNLTSDERLEAISIIAREMCINCGILSHSTYNCYCQKYDETI